MACIAEFARDIGQALKAHMAIHDYSKCKVDECSVDLTIAEERSYLSDTPSPPMPRIVSARRTQPSSAVI